MAIAFQLRLDSIHLGQISALMLYESKGEAIILMTSAQHLINQGLRLFEGVDGVVQIQQFSYE